MEDADVVMMVGALMHDFNSGAFTANLDPGRTIDIRHHRRGRRRHGLPERRDDRPAGRPGEQAGRQGGGRARRTR